MSKDMFRGLVVGVILALLLGYGVLYVRGLSARVTTIENFLNNAIRQSQQKVQEIKK